MAERQPLPDDVKGFPRSEVMVAADTVWALIAASLLPRTPEALKASALATGLRIQDLKDACTRWERGRWRVPIDQGCRAVQPEPAPPAPLQLVPDPPRPSTAPHHPNTGPATAARVAAKNPTPETRRCSGICRLVLPIEQFALREGGRRKSMCIECMKRYQRDRYLSVKKQRAMNAARLQFVVCEGDEVEGLACMDCLRPLEVGQEVHGTTSLHHVSCPPRPHVISGADVGHLYRGAP